MTGSEIRMSSIGFIRLFHQSAVLAPKNPLRLEGTAKHANIE